ncbi:MAG: GNAT family N-acetyltransferase [bacterium]|nr:GNAT family N-acetyltransferase [bacterium]
MEHKIVEFDERYKEELIGLVEKLLDYLISVDSMGRLCRMPGYGEYRYNEIIADIKKFNGKCFVVFNDDNMIGYAVCLIKTLDENQLLSATHATRGRVTHLYVDEAFRGNGLGKKLMGKAEEYFLENKCDYMWVAVFEPNENAHAMYKKLGFRDRDIDMIKKL